MPSLADGGGEVSGKVEDELAMHDHVVCRLFEVACKHFCTTLAGRQGCEAEEATITTGIEVYDRPYADIDDSQEALVLLLELLLVEDLHREHALFVYFPGGGVSALHEQVGGVKSVA